MGWRGLRDFDIARILKWKEVFSAEGWALLDGGEANGNANFRVAGRLSDVSEGFPKANNKYRPD